MALILLQQPECHRGRLMPDASRPCHSSPCALPARESGPASLSILRWNAEVPRVTVIYLYLLASLLVSKCTSCLTLYGNTIIRTYFNVDHVRSGQGHHIYQNSGTQTIPVYYREPIDYSERQFEYLCIRRGSLAPNRSLRKEPPPRSALIEV